MPKPKKCWFCGEAVDLTGDYATIISHEEVLETCGCGDVWGTGEFMHNRKYACRSCHGDLRFTLAGKGPIYGNTKESDGPFSGIRMLSATLNPSLME